jgi:alkylation response protein AidB-like acyl-CoA dehydrogenase
LLVERGMPGFEKGKRLKKLGLKAQDTSELFFDNVRCRPTAAGRPGNGGQGLLLPHAGVALGAHADRGRRRGRRPGGDRPHHGPCEGAQGVRHHGVRQFQNTRFTLAELQTEVQIARVFVDKCLDLLLAGKLDTATASMAKYWCSDLQNKVMDECVQLFGGYGFMWEYPITRAFADARVQRIYGGTNEIMKEVITRSMGLTGK